MATKRTKAVNVDFLREEEPERDLSAIFARSVADTTAITQIALDHLLDNPYQQRAKLDAVQLEELAEAIKEQGFAGAQQRDPGSAPLVELAQVIREQGFQGVLVARPHPTQRGFYQFAFGHRRRDAARLAGLAVVPVQVRDALTEEEMAELVITENIQRDDLTLLEEGRTFQLMIEVLGDTQEQIAHGVGKTRGYVENRLRVARAPADVQALVAAKPDSLRAVATLIQVNDPDLRAGAITELQAGRLTADDLPGYFSTGGISSAEEAPPDEAIASSVSARSGNGVVLGPPASPDMREVRPVGAVATTGETGAAAGPPAAPTGERARAAPATSSTEDLSENAQERVRYGALRSSLRALTRYRGKLAGRSEISVREQVALTDLTNLALELYERHRPADIAQNNG